MTPIRFPREALQDKAGLKTRRLGTNPGAGWTEPVFAEWELTGQSWTDRHPHTEYVYVLEGTLFVACGGETVECAAGDFVLVPAGASGRYWAPDHARMLSIYGPNPDGRATTVSGVEDL